MLYLLTSATMLLTSNKSLVDTPKHAFLISSSDLEKSPNYLYPFLYVLKHWLGGCHHTLLSLRVFDSVFMAHIKEKLVHQI